MQIQLFFQICKDDLCTENSLTSIYVFNTLASECGGLLVCVYVFPPISDTSEMPSQPSKMEIKGSHWGKIKENDEERSRLRFTQVSSQQQMFRAAFCPCSKNEDGFKAFQPADASFVCWWLPLPALRHHFTVSPLPSSCDFPKPFVRFVSLQYFLREENWSSKSLFKRPKFPEDS